jgi:uncharacterized iron-regulated protein
MNRSLLAGMRVLSRPGIVALAVALAGVLLAPGCGARSSGGQTTPGPASARGHGKKDVVTAAAMPYRVLRSKSGQELGEAEFYDELAAADAVCVGEVHVNPHHHWAQLQILDRLSERSQREGRAMALGMEMFQRPFQGILEDFGAGRIDEDALLSRTGWETRWGYDFELYRPLVRLAVSRGLALLALNLADELRKKVSRHGIDGLNKADRDKLPEVDLANEAHRAWFQALMDQMGGSGGHGEGGHGADDAHGPHGPHGSTGEDDEEGAARAERIYSVQVLWDETMAEAAAAWVAAETGRRIVILAGSGHCHDSAIVGRMQRRGIGKVVSVRPLLDAGDAGEDVSAELAEPITDYLFVMSPE